MTSSRWRPAGRRGACPSVFLLLILWSSTALGAQIPRDSGHNLTGLLDNLLTGYDKRLRPNYGGSPVEVGVTMYVLNIASLSEKSMEFTVDFYLRQFWRDSRLSYTKQDGLETIGLGPNFSEKIWTPDTFITNEKRSHTFSPKSGNEFIRIDPSGGVVRSIRMSMTASCAMSLAYFPMDGQRCKIELESYGYTMRDIRYWWKDGPRSVGVDETIALPQFKIVGFQQSSQEIRLSAGNYSRLICEFQFVRYIGYYVMQIYIPAALMVIISWATFWLDRDGSSASRIALGVVTVLTMTTLVCSINAYVPSSAYLKASDLYLGVCFFMVFASLIESTMVRYVLKRMRAKKDRLLTIQQLAIEQAKGKTVNKVANEKDAEEVASVKAAGALTLSDEKFFGIEGSDIDKYSRILFPILFICFNLIYWVIYLHIGGVTAKDLILL